MKNILTALVLIFLFFITPLTVAVAQEITWGEVIFVVGTSNDGRHWMKVVCSDQSGWMAFLIKPFSPSDGNPGPAKILTEDIYEYPISCDCGETIIVSQKLSREIKKEPRAGYSHTEYFASEVIKCMLVYPNGQEKQVPIPEIQTEWDVKKPDKLASTWGKIKRVGR